jgi:hypothetical protein
VHQDRPFAPGCCGPARRVDLFSGWLARAVHGLVPHLKKVRLRPRVRGGREERALQVLDQRGNARMYADIAALPKLRRGPRGCTLKR